LPHCVRSTQSGFFDLASLSRHIGRDKYQREEERCIKGLKGEAQVVASVCGNLYLKTSWCIGEEICWMISTIGPDRVMMGADLPSDAPVEIAKYRALDLTTDVYVKVMDGTAIDVFKLS
jgi:predicted TIM-barrel fold metal-dependent hydrolase